MTPITFDPLKYVKTLKAAGFDDRQAEALAEAQAGVFDKNLESLATRQDLSEAKVEIVKWVAGLLLAQTGLIFTLIKLFPSH